MTEQDNHAEPPAEALDRAALFAAGPPKIPGRTIWIALAFAAVLGIGGAFADHSFNVPPTPTPTPVVDHAASQHQSLASFVGLRSLGGALAPTIDLTDGSGHAFSLSDLEGRPVLVTFLGAPCTGNCPVVASELAQAQSDLRRAHLDPAVVIVNADPAELAPAQAHAALERAALRAIGSPVFLTGPLARIEEIWKAYGVTVELDPSTDALAYTNVIDIVDASGRLRYSVTPFANEAFSGSSTLPAGEVARFATGIATYVEKVSR